MVLAGVLFAAEAAARLVAGRLPEEAGRWPHVTIARKYEQMRALSRKRERFDVVFVGSSMVVNGIDPIAFTKRSGKLSYNAAFPAASARSTTAWTRGVVLPLLRPKVVVVGVTSRDLNDNGKIQNRRYHQLLRSPGYKQVTSGLDHKMEGMLERHSYFLRYRREFRRPARLIQRVSEKKQSQRAPISRFGKRIGKRWNATYRASARWKARMRANALRRFTTGDTELQSLGWLRRHLADRGIGMVIISMPVTDDYRDAHPAPDDMAEYRRAIKRFAMKHNVPFVDAERALPGTDGFGDPVHLDGRGRDALTRALAGLWDGLMSRGQTTMKFDVMM